MVKDVHVAGFAFLLLVVFTAVLSGPVSLNYTVTDSMRDSIQPGDVVISLSNEPPKESDIVSFDAVGFQDQIMHRIVGTSAEGYVTKGDDNSQIDQLGILRPVKPEDVKSVIVEYNGSAITIPQVGFVLEEYGPGFSMTVFLLLNSSFIILFLIIRSGECTLQNILYSLRNPGSINLSDWGKKDIIHLNKQWAERWVAICVAALAFIILVNILVTPSVVATSAPPGETYPAKLSGQSSGEILFFDHRIVATAGAVEVADTESKTGVGQSILIRGDTINEVDRLEQIQNPPTRMRGALYVYHYPRILPSSILNALHNISPWVASGILSFIILSGGFVFFYGVWVGGLNLNKRRL